MYRICRRMYLPDGRAIELHDHKPLPIEVATMVVRLLKSVDDYGSDWWLVPAA